MSTTTTTITHPDGTSISTTSSSAAAAPAGLQLWYWNGRGLMEVARMILAAAGKKAGDDYADIRVTTDMDAETGQQLKNGEPVVDADGKPVMYDKGDKDVRAMASLGAKGEPGLLDINLGRVPLLVCAEGAIGQKRAIDYYLADCYGLNGANAFECGTIVAINEALVEMQAAWDKMMPPKDGATDEEKAANTAEKIKAWFAESAAKDYCGPSDMSGTRGERRAMRHAVGLVRAVVVVIVVVVVVVVIVVVRVLLGVLVARRRLSWRAEHGRRLLRRQQAAPR